MMTKLCLSVFLLSSVVFGLPVEENGLAGSGTDYPPNLARSPMDFGVNREDRIYGGREAEDGQFPHQASIRAESGHFCGGSILNEHFILTTASCVNGRSSSPNRFRVVVGAYEISYEDGTFHNVQRVIVHEGYVYTQNRTKWIIRNDIALLRTTETIEFNDLVRPIRLHSGFIGTAKAVTSGWGRANDRVYNLKYLNVITMTNDECRRILISKYPTITPPVHDYDCICASSERFSGVCKGDEGGPLTVDNQLVGITSWTYSCGGGFPEGYTRVSSYIDWINKNMQNF